MSTTANSANLQSSFFETAKVRVVSRRPRPRSDYKLAYVIVSSRIYWRKVANGDKTYKPQSFVDFRNVDSLELVRLEDGTWNDVDAFVKLENHNGGERIIVCGRPHGRTRRHALLRGSNVEVEIIPNAPEQLERWVNHVRARIAPWSLLQQVVMDLANRGPSCKPEEIEKALGGFLTSTIGTELSSFLPGKVEGKRIDNLGTLPEQIEQASVVDELIAHGTAAVEACAALSKLAAKHVGETAEVVGDAAKCVAGVSTFFHLVALGAQVVSMCAEASRGRRVLLVLLAQIMVLLKYILESLSEILKSSRKVNQTDIDFVFDVFRQAVDAIDMAETQLLRGRGSQIMNAGDVKEIERKVEELKQMAVIAGNTSKCCAIDERLNRFEGHEIWNDLPHHVRPSLTAFFSGRTKELNVLRGMLEKYGSAVITQYGGLGKTELMIAFASRTELDGVVPGGVFWVTVDGDERDVISSLAILAEKIAGKKMGEDERRNPNMVIAALKQGLNGREGRWLLCMDNADDSKLSGILNEVCGIVEGTRGNGWILVTSRQGQPHIWTRMKDEQRLVLEPLSLKDAMVALWRQIRKIEMDDANDDLVMNAIKELEKTDSAEYRALKELCADEGECGLGGLPLALVQAGTYMARFKCSISEYLQMFKSAYRIEDMQDIMRNTEDVKPIHELQRSIWTTWQINVRQLSKEAYSVLGSMAMLGTGGVGEAIVKGIVRKVTADEGCSVDWMFRKHVIEELIHGSSLIYRYGGGKGGSEPCKYGMHRLIRLFVLRNTERGSDLWDEMFSAALVSLHEGVEIELKNEGKSFGDLPNVFGNNHREFMLQATTLVKHCTPRARGAGIWDISKVENIHRYSGDAMKFVGKVEEEVQVWESLVDILHHQKVSNRSQNSCGPFSDAEHEKTSRIAGVYNSLGNALKRNGRLNDAVLMHQKSLEMYLAIHGHDKPHPAIATSLSNLGRVYERLGKLEEALEKHEKSLKMKLVIHGQGKPHPAIATSLSNIGVVYQGMSKLDEALEKHEKSLEMYLTIHGHDKSHPDIATSLGNLGHVYQRLGKQDKAMEMYEKSLEMYVAIHGHDKPHPAIATALHNLGHVFQRLGRLEESLQKYEKSIEMYLAIYGHDKPHPDIATSLGSLGRVHERLGKQDEALKIHKKSLKMYLAIYGHGKPHPDIATSLSNLGHVYQSLGKLDKAMAMHEKSLEMRQAIHGNDEPHPAIATSLSNLGHVYQRWGRLEEASEKYEKTLELYLAIYGHDKPHPDIAASLNNLGHVYERLGKLDEALEQHTKSLEMYLAMHGHDKPHPAIATSLSNLGIVYARLGKLEEALEKHEQSLEMELSMHGHDKPHSDIAISLWHIGLLYRKQNRLNQAAEFLGRSLAMLGVVYAGNLQHPYIKRLRRHLAAVYKDRKEQDAAETSDSAASSLSTI